MKTILIIIIKLSVIIIKNNQKTLKIIQTNYLIRTKMSDWEGEVCWDQCSESTDPEQCMENCVWGMTHHDNDDN